ncbi:chromosome partitioning ATP-binding protein [Novosphingobium sp. Rr 2-17]|uniref:Mrp/NBP35 family ATP-binding protein n=1 Tax=Novosphingobium sp. Rr 2-17 TaxID=555793 RepID=UPI00026995A2|nr:Mrp/NBP35 family ATP-binding protein [Novosphingobium sp. Rr 2-17]EIZ77463.1 chromosome partitioning ATP-binding protein [Novosphingobium sp. Rr 2-17]
MTQETGDTLKALLPETVRPRVRTLRQTGTAVTAVLDAQGLSLPAREALEGEVRQALSAVPGIEDVRVAMMADKSITRIVAVGSGKGGVGKSTVATNLAVALARMGRKVGLVDADIYGPSQARLMGTEGQRPVAHDQRLVPVESAFGVPMLSMAHLSKPGEAIAWRGPMASGAVTKMLEGHWDQAEVLIVDLPPGTGDIQLTMLQKFKPAGAVIVSTPQDLALIDATRAAELFAKSGVPVIGMVENMSGYACPHCGEISDPFGCGGAEDTAKDIGTPFLGRIPLEIAIRQQSDAGDPPAAGNGPQAAPFAALAVAVDAWLRAHP